MADFMTSEPGMEREPSANETAFADHLLTRPADAIPVYEGEQLTYWIDPKTYKFISAKPPEPELTEAEQIARSHEFADNDDTIAKCYFIGGDDGPIKIGYALNVKDRLRRIQSHSPIPLRVLAVASGGYQRECAYHWQFAASRLHGEWFERVPEIEAEIDRLQTLSADENI